jgi:hypothetical protein
LKRKGIPGKRDKRTGAKIFLTSHPKTRITLKTLIFLDHWALPLDRIAVSRHTLKRHVTSQLASTAL